MHKKNAITSSSLTSKVMLMPLKASQLSTVQYSIYQEKIFYLHLKSDTKLHINRSSRNVTHFSG